MEAMDFRTVLLKIQNLLSDKDRECLHFLLGDDVPRNLRDDSTIGGTLRVLQTLLDKDKINDQDCDYLIKALIKIECFDAAKRLQDYRKSLCKAEEQTYSLSTMVLLDDDQARLTKPITEKVEPPFDLKQSQWSDTYQHKVKPVATNGTIEKQRWLIVAGILVIFFSLLVSSVALFIALPQKSKENLPESSVSPSCLMRWNTTAETVVHGINEPIGLFIDPNQTMYISSWSSHSIIVWTVGALQGEVFVGGQGDGLDQLYHPTDITLNQKMDKIIVCDFGNHRVMSWPRHSQSRSLHATSRQGEILIDSISCWGLAMSDNGVLYISDWQHNEVRRYGKGKNKKGTVVIGQHGQGANLNQLHHPTYLFLDAQSTLYVTDKENQRVMKWVKGAKEGIVVAGGNGRSIDRGQLAQPKGVWVDRCENVFVVDRRKSQVMRWHQQQNRNKPFIVVGGEEGNGANQLNAPQDLFFDHLGYLYVVDYGNHRVQRFSPISQ